MEEYTMIRTIAEAIYSSGGADALAHYLQGSGGECISCGKTFPHDVSCLFVKAAKEILRREIDAKINKER